MWCLLLATGTGRIVSRFTYFSHQSTKRTIVKLIRILSGPSCSPIIRQPVCLPIHLPNGTMQCAHIQEWKMLMKHDTIEFQVSDVSSKHFPASHRHSFCCETTIHYGHFPIAFEKEGTKLKLFPENACSKLDLMPTQMTLFCRPCLGCNRRLVYLFPHKKKDCNSIPVRSMYTCQCLFLRLIIRNFSKTLLVYPTFLIYYFSFLICFPSTFFRSTVELEQSGAVLIFVDVIHAIAIWLFIHVARNFASLRNPFLII